MAKLVNRAKMRTATTGTGAVTLGAAVDAFQTFAEAGVADSEVVRYVVEEGDNWEIGTGTYTAAGPTLSRTVSESSNSGSPVNLSGNAVVYVTAVAADINTRVSYLLQSLDGTEQTQARANIGAAPLDSPTLTGTPTAPTPTAGDDSTKIATTAYVQGELPTTGTAEGNVPVLGVGGLLPVSTIPLEGLTPTNVAASRVGATFYTNNTGKLLFVNMCVRRLSGGAGSITTDDGVGGPSTVIGRVPASTDPHDSISFFVPPGWRYRANVTVDTVSWLEWS